MGSGSAAGPQLLILVHGVNLLRTQLKHRLSPDALRALGAVEQLSPMLLSEWQVAYLVQAKVRLADTLSLLLVLHGNPSLVEVNSLRGSAGELGSACPAGYNCRLRIPYCGVPGAGVLAWQRVCGHLQAAYQQDTAGGCLSGASQAYLLLSSLRLHASHLYSLLIILQAPPLAGEKREVDLRPDLQHVPQSPGAICLSQSMFA